MRFSSNLHRDDDQRVLLAAKLMDFSFRFEDTVELVELVFPPDEH